VSIRFIHSGDWQLGMTRAFLSDEAAARFSQARIDAITRLGALAREHEAAFLVVAGDVFESNQLSRQVLARSLAALRELPVPVFLLPGNHDPLDGTSVFATPEFRHAGAGVLVLEDSRPRPVPGLSGVEVQGAPWTSKRPTRDPAAVLYEHPPEAAAVRIAVAHGQIDRLAPEPNRPELIRLDDAERALAAGLFHYLALGDRHSVTAVGDTGRIWYAGTPVATDFDEVAPNQALLVTLTPDRPGAAPAVKPLAVGDWHFVAADFALNGDGDLDRLAAWLDTRPAPERTALKLGLTGSIGLATAARLDRLLEDQRELFASLRLRTRTTDLRVLPDELDEESLPLSGYALAAWRELLDAAGRGDEEARDALQLCYRLAQRSSA